MSTVLTQKPVTAAARPSSTGGKIASVIPAITDTVLPQQSTVALERLFRKQRLAAGYRLFARLGYDMGGAGHITARDPEFTDHFWVNPHAVHFSQISVSELMLVNHDGKIVEPPATKPARLNRAAFAIHSELHRARPEVVAAAHSHSFHGKTFSSLGRLLDPITQDACPFFENHVLFEGFSGVVRDTSEGEKIALALGSKNAAILQHHGLLTLGQTVESAVWRFIAMEEACRTQLIAQAAGTPKLIPAEIARTASMMGSEVGGIYAFEPYWEWLTAQEPDLLD